MTFLLNNVFFFIFQVAALKQIIIKKEKECEAIAASLKKTNDRLGVEHITDTSDEASDSDNSAEANSDIDINTRHYQKDPDFAKNYFFITNVS